MAETSQVFIVSTSKHLTYSDEVGAVAGPTVGKAGIAGDTKFQIDLSEFPIDEILLDRFEVEQLINFEILPWRKFGQRLVYVTGNIGITPPPCPFEGVTNVDFILADPVHIQKYLEELAAEKLLDTARNLCPEN